MLSLHISLSCGERAVLMIWHKIPAVRVKERSFWLETPGFVSVDTAVRCPGIVVQVVGHKYWYNTSKTSKFKLPYNANILLWLIIRPIILHCLCWLSFLGCTYICLHYRLWLNSVCFADRPVRLSVYNIFFHNHEVCLPRFHNRVEYFIIRDTDIFQWLVSGNNYFQEQIQRSEPALNRYKITSANTLAWNYIITITGFHLSVWLKSPVSFEYGRHNFPL